MTSSNYLLDLRNGLAPITSWGSGSSRPVPPVRPIEKNEIQCNRKNLYRVTFNINFHNIVFTFRV